MIMIPHSGLMKCIRYVQVEILYNNLKYVRSKCVLNPYIPLGNCYRNLHASLKSYKPLPFIDFKRI